MLTVVPKPGWLMSLANREGFDHGLNVQNAPNGYRSTLGPSDRWWLGKNGWLMISTRIMLTTVIYV